MKDYNIKIRLYSWAFCFIFLILGKTGDLFASQEQEDSSAIINEGYVQKNNAPVVQDPATELSREVASVKRKIAQKPGELNQNLKLAKAFFKENYYNLALFHMMEAVKEKPEFIERWSKLIDKILDKTGTLPLYVYEVNFLKKIPSTTIALHLAHVSFKEKKYEETLNFLLKLDPSNSYYPEAMLLQGTVLDILKKPGSSESFNSCILEADKFANFTQLVSFKRYFILIKEECLINQARSLYREEKYNASLDLYNLIDKKSYSFPFLLLDKAWNYYKKNDYNRALGLVMTYRSPLLESYFLPEAEVLQALSYFRLCLYKDAAVVIDQFYNVYGEKAKSLRSIIDQYANSPNYFFNLLTNSQNADFDRPYIKNLKLQLNKQLKNIIHLAAYEKAKKELERMEGTKINSKAKAFMKQAVANMEKLINQHAKEYIYFFLNSINYYSYEMFNIKLEIISKKKDLLYENKKLISNRARGNVDNVKAGEYEFFYGFNGEFWADEIGDYSFGLKSNCKTVEVKDVEANIFDNKRENKTDKKVKDSGKEVEIKTAPKPIESTEEEEYE